MSLFLTVFVGPPFVCCGILWASDLKYDSRTKLPAHGLQDFEVKGDLSVITFLVYFRYLQLKHNTNKAI